MKTDPTAVALCSHGEILFQRGDLPGAKEAFGRALQIDPALADAHNNLGVWHYGQNQVEPALEHFAKALAIEPNHGSAVENLEGLLERLDHRTAWPTVQKLLHRALAPRRPENKGTLVVMGNGPSLKSISFDLLRRFDTFGLNAAYRMYPKLGWWPSYHGCFDFTVTESHWEEYKNLTLGDNPIRRFFYLKRVSDSPRLQKINLVPFGTNEKWNESEADFLYFHDGGNSGVNACQVGICLGYRKILLVGVDCNYVEVVAGAKEESGRLVIEKTPETNPNYWFDDYQQQGDRYNFPRGTTFHLPAWNVLAQRAAERGIEILNCSPGSKLDCFPLSTIEKELEKEGKT